MNVCKSSNLSWPLHVKDETPVVININKRCKTCVWSFLDVIITCHNNNTTSLHIMSYDDKDDNDHINKKTVITIIIIIFIINKP